MLPSQGYKLRQQHITALGVRFFRSWPWSPPAACPQTPAGPWLPENCSGGQVLGLRESTLAPVHVESWCPLQLGCLSGRENGKDSAELAPLTPWV